MAHANRFQWTLEQEIAMFEEEELESAEELRNYLCREEMLYEHLGSPLDDPPVIVDDTDDIGIGDDFDFGEDDFYYELLIRSAPPHTW